MCCAGTECGDIGTNQSDDIPGFALEGTNHGFESAGLLDFLCQLFRGEPVVSIFEITDLYSGRFVRDEVLVRQLHFPRMRDNAKFSGGRRTHSN